MNYEEKQQLKLERYQEIQERTERESKERYNQSTRLSESIPLGQPILVGHHSEKRHRRDIERIHNDMDKSIELQKKAEHYKKKVENILNPKAISSDNPKAIELLKEKLKYLENRRIQIKEKNKHLKKEGKEKLPSYLLNNLSGNIKNVKDRIKHLEILKTIPETEETINNVLIKTDKEENRVKLFFPNIPTEEIRNKLKRNGFKWSFYNKCWQRQLNEYSLYLAKEIIKEMV